MTNEGISRILELIKDDIDSITCDVNGVTQPIEITQIIHSVYDELSIIAYIEPEVEGILDNFRLIGVTGIYDIKNYSYEKVAGSTQLVTLKYKLEIKAVE